MPAPELWAAFNFGKFLGDDEAQPAAEFPMFTGEAERELKERGYVIYDLTGQSIRDLVQSGLPIQSFSSIEDIGLDTLTSSVSQVAIDPNNLLLPWTHNKTLHEQQKVVVAFSKNLKIEGVEAKIGGLADYAELTFRHHKATRNRLFGIDDDFVLTRTITPTIGSSVACIGNFDADHGLQIRSLSSFVGDFDILAAPILYPTQK